MRSLRESREAARRAIGNELVQFQEQMHAATDMTIDTRRRAYEQAQYDAKSQEMRAEVEALLARADAREQAAAAQDQTAQEEAARAQFSRFVRSVF